MNSQPTITNRERQLDLLSWTGSLALHLAVLSAMGYVAVRGLSGLNSPSESIALELSFSPQPESEELAPEEPLESPVEIAEVRELTLTPEVNPPAPVEPPPEPVMAITPKPSPVVEARSPRSIFAPTSQRVARAQPSGSVRGRIPDGYTTTRVFGLEGTGTKFVYLFDRSISMAGRPLAAAKSQLVGSLELLRPVNQFQILFFNHRLTVFDATGGQGRVAFASQDNKSRAEHFVSRINADGGTDRFASLEHAADLAPDVLFFLTDADDPMTAYELNKSIEWFQRSATAVQAIEFGRGPSKGRRNFLTELSDATGGGYRYVDTTALSAAR